MFSVPTSPAHPSASFLSTSPVYFRKQIHEGVGHNQGDSLQKQFGHQRNCNWNDTHETVQKSVSAGRTDKRPSIKLSPFSLRCSWGVWTPRFTALNQEDTVLHSCCTSPTGNMMLKRCWGTFVYKPKSSDVLQCWLPYIPLISNHCVLKNKTKQAQNKQTKQHTQTKPTTNHSVLIPEANWKICLL